MGVVERNHNEPVLLYVEEVALGWPAPAEVSEWIEALHHWTEFRDRPASRFEINPQAYHLNVRRAPFDQGAGEDTVLVELFTHKGMHIAHRIEQPMLRGVVRMLIRMADDIEPGLIGEWRAASAGTERLADLVLKALETANSRLRQELATVRVERDLLKRQVEMLLAGKATGHRSIWRGTLLAVGGFLAAVSGGAAEGASSVVAEVAAVKKASPDPTEVSAHELLQECTRILSIVDQLAESPED